MQAPNGRHAASARWGAERRGRPARGSGPRSGRLSVGTCQVISPVSPSAWRLVARTRRPGHPRSSASVSAAQASSTCSQLSSTSSSSLSRSTSRTASSGGWSASRTPSARAIAEATRDGSSRSASSTIRDAVRVVGPELIGKLHAQASLPDARRAVSVISRWAVRSCSSSWISRSRPTKLANGRR